MKTLISVNNAISFASARKARLRLMATTILVSGGLFAGQVFAGAAQPALPSGGQVVAGQATISGSGSQTVISQSSDKAIIDWNDFSIGKGGEVNIQNGSGATLNRVTGTSLSSIDGLLKATGSVYLINPNGVIIGKDGVVRVGGSFVASTLDISNNNFLNGGDQTFAGSSLASVVNLGKIGALGGNVALMAVDVSNNGTIDAAGGTAGLIAGHKIIMRDTGVNDGKFLVVTGGADTSVSNDGAIAAASAELRAEGGNIYALAGNTQGVIRATGVTTTDGKVFLTAGAGTVNVSGSTIAASDSAGNGGAISVTGQTITVAADATLDASSTATTGKGGTISVIADKASGSLSFQGTALAKGGAAGGLVETSGASVNFDGARINTASTDGLSGNWLIDPYDLTVDSTAAATISTNLATTGVTLQTTAVGTSGPGTANSGGNGDIIINSDINWSSSNTLTLDAYRSVQFNASATSTGSGGVSIKTNDGGSGGDYTFAQGKSLSLTTGGSLSINSTAYTLVNSMSGLAGMTNGSYALTTDLTGGNYTDNVNTGTVSGTFTGLGHTIDSLNITSGGGDDGLFYGNTGTLRDFGVTNLTVDTGGGSDASGVVAYNQGTVANVWTTGFIAGSYAGGISAENGGTIRNSFSSANISSYGDTVGGLVGYNDHGSQIVDSYATGTVTNANGFAGGLVGQNAGSITTSYSTGLVTNELGALSGQNGGLVGLDGGGTVTNSYWDTQTSGQSTSAGGTGKTTAQLQGTLPAGYDSSIWATGSGLYPYLKAFYGTVTADQKISGYAYNADGSDANAATVGIYSGGASLGVSAATGANGYYYILVSPGTATSSSELGAALTLSGDTNVSGLSYTNAPSLTSGDVVNFNVRAGLIDTTTSATSYTGLQTVLSNTFGSSALSAALANISNPDYKITTSGAFTLDTALTGGGAVAIKTGGDLTISNAITASGSKALTLDSHDNLYVNAALTASGSNAVTLTTADGGTGDYYFALGDSLSFTGSGGSLNINGNAYTLLYSLSDFSSMEGSTGKFALAQSLDASSASYTASVVSNFSTSSNHSGIFTGLGNTISNLAINDAVDQTVGLFGTNYGTIRDIGLAGGSVTGTNGYPAVGSLAGFNASGASIKNSFASTQVTGIATSAQVVVGGLVGSNSGTISNSFARGTVSGSAVNGSGYVGGLVGYQAGTINDSFAMGAVSGTSQDNEFGGIIGVNYGSVNTSYATGYVSGSGSTGGVVGANHGTVISSYYDSGTTGQSDTGKGLAQTTAELQGTVPSGFSASVWGTDTGLYPYLKSFGAVTPDQKISGYAYNTDGSDANAATVGIYSGGASLGVSGSTGANGYYYILVLPGTATASTDLSAALTLSGDTHASGLTYTNAPTLTGADVTDLDVTSGQLKLSGDATTLTGLFSDLSDSMGNSTYQDVASHLGAVDIDITASGDFTLDSALSYNQAVSIKSGGDLTVADDITFGGTKTLTLDAYNNLYINANIDSVDSNAVVLKSADGGTGDYSFDLQGDGFHGGLNFTGTGASLSINNDAYTLLYSLSDLQGINHGTGHYALATTLDASSLGTLSSSLIGTLNNGSVLTGLGHTVDNLMINSTSGSVGLIGTSLGTVRDIGSRGGVISDSNSEVGGLIGYQSGGMVSSSYATGAVSGDEFVGGLIGYQSGGTVSSSYATGAVSGDEFVGGLIGEEDFSTISSSYATGAVSGTNYLGGLIGNGYFGTVSSSYATGAVTGGDIIGGLIGYMYSTTVNSSYATGAVTGGGNIGGLIGYQYLGTITNSYYNSDTSGMSDTGKGTGLTTAQLQGALPSGFSSSVWATGSGLYPYLKTFYPDGVQVISGGALDSSGSVAAGGRIDVYSGGSLLDRTSSGANGYYYMIETPGKVTASTDLAAVLTLSGDSYASGLVYTNAPVLTAGNLNDFDVASGLFKMKSDATTLSGMSLALNNTLGNATDIDVVGHLPVMSYALTADGDFTVDSTISGNGVSIVSSGDLTIAHNFTVSGANSLTLDAHDNLYINAEVTASGSNAVELKSADGGSGDYSFDLQSDGFHGGLNFTGTGGSLSINGTPYTLLYSLSDLAGINNGTGHYALATTLDASSAGTLSSSVLGTLSGGVLTGLGHTVDNLTINSSDNYVGLIGTNLGAVRDIGSRGGVVSTSDAYEVGGLIGYQVGGTVSSSYATGAVSGVRNVGGLIGYIQSGTVTSSYATGAVSGTNYLGGLIGEQYYGTVTSSYATGAVSGTNYLGGLIGVSENDTVSSSYATGAISGANEVGGLIGYISSGTVTSSYATGATSGAGDVGGLIGIQYVGTVTNSYYDSDTSGMSDTGKGLGMTTAQLQGTLPSGFDSNVWATGSGLYPYLKSFYPDGAQAISGMAYDGNAAAVAGAQVALSSGGAQMVSASSGANGYYYAMVMPGTVTSASDLGGALTLSGAANVSGLTYTYMPTLTSGNVSGFDVYDGLINATTSATSYSGLQTALSNTFGASALSGILTDIGSPDYKINATGAFDFDQATTFAAGLDATASGGLTLSQNLTTAGATSFNSAVTLGDDITINDTSGGISFGSTIDGAHNLTLTGASLGLNGAIGGTTVLTSLTGTATQYDISLGGQITTSGNILLVSNSSFTNTAGASALNAGGNFTVYTQNAADVAGTMPVNTLDGLTGTNYYNDAYDFGTGTFASAVPTGNHFVYGYAASLTPTLSGSASKTYDALLGADTSGLSIGATLLSADDSVSFSITSANFDTKNAGTGKTVTANIGFSSNPNNYTLSATTASANIGTINKAALTLAAVSATKTYDASTGSTGVVTFSGLQGSDSVSDATQSFDSQNAGSRTLSVNSGYTVNDGNSGGNYTVSTTTASGTINKAALTLAAVSATKTYDATTGSTGVVTFSGLQGSDSVSDATQSFDSQNAGSRTLSVNSGYTVNDGNSGGNYTVSTTTASGTINKAALTLAAVSATKTYDAGTGSTGVVTFSGLQGSDSVSDATQSFDSQNAGSRTLSVNSGYTVNDGNSGGNYTVSTTTASGTINKAALTLAAVSATKTYDAGTGSTGVVTVSGLQGSDSVSDATQSFDSQNAGSRTLSVNSGYTVNDGNSGGNYTVSTTTASGTINKAALTLAAVSATKTYDAGTGSTGVVTVSGLQGSDSVSDATQSFDSQNAGSRTLSVNSGYTVNDGNSGGNYTVSTTTASGTINKAALTAGLTGSVTKTYDATTDASLTHANYTLSGVLSGDDAALNDPATGTYDDQNAGSAKTVSVTGLALTGTDAGNYVVNSSASANIGTITLRPITITADSLGKLSTTPDPLLTYVLTSGSLAGNDALTGGLIRAPGEDPGAYAITQGSLAASSNYNVTFTGATFTIAAIGLQNQPLTNPILNDGTPPPGSGTGQGSGGSSGGNAGGSHQPEGSNGQGGTSPQCLAGEQCVYPSNQFISSHISFSSH